MTCPVVKNKIKQDFDTNSIFKRAVSVLYNPQIIITKYIYLVS